MYIIKRNESLYLTGDHFNGAKPYTQEQTKAKRFSSKSEARRFLIQGGFPDFVREDEEVRIVRLIPKDPRTPGQKLRVALVEEFNASLKGHSHANPFSEGFYEWLSKNPPSNNEAGRGFYDRALKRAGLV